MIYPTDVLTETQLTFVAAKLPQPHAQTGRPAYTNLELLPGILKVLRSGCRWRDLDLPGYPDGVTHWRRLRYWQRRQRFVPLWHHILRLLTKTRTLKPSHLSLDGSLFTSFAFQEKTGYSGKHHLTGVKLSTMVDATGLPVSLVVDRGNVVDISLAKLTVKALQLPRCTIRGSTILGDKGYDAKPFRQFVMDKELFPCIKKRKNVKVRKKHQFLYLYSKDQGKKRFVVERSHAWLKSFRRLRHRFDYTAASFEAFVMLAIIVVCVRKLLP